jgi:hypothetical protein
VDSVFLSCKAVASVMKKQKEPVYDLPPVRKNGERGRLARIVGRAYLPDMGPLKMHFHLMKRPMSGKYARPARQVSKRSLDKRSAVQGFNPFGASRRKFTTVRLRFITSCGNALCVGKTKLFLAAFRSLMAALVSLLQWTLA